MIGDYQKIPPQQGWQCPVCGRIYSPTTMMCFYCGNKTETKSTTYMTGTPDYLHHDTVTGSTAEGEA